MDHYQPTKGSLIQNNIYRTKLDGLFYLEHTQYSDERGFFAELALIPDLNEITDINFSIAQINQAHSTTNVIRGFHAEDWNKLVYIVQGIAFCALADTRPDSNTFGQVETFMFGNHPEKTLNGALFVSSGIANSICVTKGPVDYLYFVDQLYRDRAKDDDVAISLFDQDLAVYWPIAKESMIFSDRDNQSITLRQKFPDKFK